MMEVEQWLWQGCIRLSVLVNLLDSGRTGVAEAICTGEIAIQAIKALVFLIDDDKMINLAEWVGDVCRGRSCGCRRGCSRTAAEESNQDEKTQ